MKKLSLSKETISSLNEDQLGQVQGGGKNPLSNTNCEPLCRPNDSDLNCGGEYLSIQEPCVNTNWI